jgi:hypothetical protein
MGFHNRSTGKSISHLAELYEAWGKPENDEEWRAKLQKMKDVEQ